MEITQANTDGLKRTLNIVIGANELSDRFTERLGEFSERVQLKGFRKGKVPVAHLKKLYGRSLMAEVLDQAVDDTSSQAIADRKERPALQPDIELPEDQDEIERVIDGKADLAYSMTFEVLPEIAIADLSKLKLERLTADVDDAAIEKALWRAWLTGRSATTAEEGRDDWRRRPRHHRLRRPIDGEAFDGGTGEGAGIVIGQSSFIPGFEDGLKGAKAGEERVVNATFPADYPVQTLAGKDCAVFDVKVKEVAKRRTSRRSTTSSPRSLGVEDLGKLRELVSAQSKTSMTCLARQAEARSSWTRSTKAHDFELPAALVETEFEQIWKQLRTTSSQQDKTLRRRGQDRGRGEGRVPHASPSGGCASVSSSARSARRTSPGLQDELRRALIEQARRYPGQEKMVYEYYREERRARWPSCARRSSRTRSSTTCSSRPSRPRRR